MQQLESRLLAWASNLVGSAGSSPICMAELETTPLKNENIIFLNLNFIDLFIVPESGIPNFFVTQYLTTLELKIFIGEYSLTLESRIL